MSLSQHREVEPAHDSRGAAGKMRFQIVLFVIARMLTNVGMRMAYPFLPVLARSVGVPLETMSLAVTARNGLGLAGPLLGTVGDRWGHRKGMLAGVAVFCVGLVVVVIWPTYPALFAGLLLVAAGKIIFDPSMQAYLGSRIPYEQRGQALALTEMSWSTASLFGLPLVGWLISRAGWVSPFVMLAGLGVVIGVLLWRALPEESHSSAVQLSSPWDSMRMIIRQPQAVGGLVFILLICISTELVTIVYGAWLENAFVVQVTGLGVAAAIIGFAELTGEGLVAAWVDRIGKRRAAAIGTAGFAAACLLLPVIGRTLTGALIASFLFYLTFEFTLVSSVPLMTELVPDARVAMMAANISILSAGHMIGAAAGPLLFRSGMALNSLAAAAIAVIALAVLLLFVKKD